MCISWVHCLVTLENIIRPASQARESELHFSASLSPVRMGWPTTPSACHVTAELWEGIGVAIHEKASKCLEPGQVRQW